MSDEKTGMEWLMANAGPRIQRYSLVEHDRIDSAMYPRDNGAWVLYEDVIRALRGQQPLDDHLALLARCRGYVDERHFHVQSMSADLVIHTASCDRCELVKAIDAAVKNRTPQDRVGQKLLAEPDPGAITGTLSSESPAVSDRPLAWVATKGDQVLHFSLAEGWEVNEVMRGTAEGHAFGKLDDKREYEKRHSECCRVNGVPCLRQINKAYCPDHTAAMNARRT